MAAPSGPRLAAADASRFVPGQVVADRYRMVGLLGKGGMGEVYRADDLTLGQPVALKFLPREIAADGSSLERFLTEVRLSLKVTHPNICRVFDIGEVDGRHFLSMEFIDGEDLSSLLRRIGRLPEDKAVEIARQLCAGLSAAHAEGVLHRDLKPANIMIDGRGRAKITDFGLAGATAGIAGREAQAGTPHYMAPEQFDGRPLNVRTDLYALGLVLYELFTGKRAFETEGRLDLAALRATRDTIPTTPSAHVTGLNPIVERAILRCLEPEPDRRPSSAQHLADSLPGGDPLAMAIAAGETPSPDVVARAGGRGELSPRVAIALLTAVLAGLGVVWFTPVGMSDLQNRIPLPKPPDELRLIARSALAAGGHNTAAASTAWGFLYDADFFAPGAHQPRDPLTHAATADPAPLWFWYRESSRPMVPTVTFGAVTHSEPALTEAGMARVRLDPAGRLQEFVTIPADMPDTPGPWPEPDWSPLFTAAGLALEEWSGAVPMWPPFRAADTRRAWTKGALRIEATSFRGRPTWFRVVPPWRRPAVVGALPRDSNATAVLVLFSVVLVAVVGGGVLIVTRNLRMGRGDRRGAFRAASAFVALGAAIEILRLTGAPLAWLLLFMGNFSIHVLIGGLLWIAYLAVEPFVRRSWPTSLISWSRVIEARFTDPLVGRHMLIGALAGLVATLLGRAAEWMSATPWDEGWVLPMAWTSGSALAADFLQAIQVSFAMPLFYLLAILVLRVIVRRQSLAYAAFLLMTGVFSLLTGGSWWMTAGSVLTSALTLVVLNRFGIFAMVVMTIFSTWPALALSTNPESWFFPQSVVVMAMFAGLAVYGFWISLAGQKLFRDEVLP